MYTDRVNKMGTVVGTCVPDTELEQQRGQVALMRARRRRYGKLKKMNIYFYIFHSN